MIKRDQIIKLAVVTVTDILSDAGNLIEFELDSIKLEDERIKVVFTFKYSVLSTAYCSSHEFKLSINDLEEWAKKGADELVNQISNEISKTLGDKND